MIDSYSGEPSGAGNMHTVSDSVKKFTWKELSKLNSRHNAHVAYRGKVYDVSGFVSRHPGGVEQIMAGSSRDITQAFESYHKEDTVKILKQFYVGELIDNELPVFPPRGEFYRTVKKRVEEYYEAENKDPKNDNWMFFRYAIFVTSALFSMYCVMQFHDYWTLGTFSAILWGFFSSLIVFTSAHDSSHFALTHKPWVWKFVSWASLDCFNGVSTFAWTYQHILGHHLYTNIDGVDPDIFTVENDYRRIKEHQKWLPQHFYQHIYVPLMYCVLKTKLRLEDFYKMFTLKNATIRMNPPTLFQWVWFFAGKAIHFSISFYIPWLYMPFTSVIYYNIVADLTLSYWSTLVFQVSHTTSEVDWPKYDTMVVDRDWAELQVATTLDYATDSWFWTVFTGALNHQVAHHLFPGVIQSHYMKITSIVKKTCEEFGLTYHYVRTFREGLSNHVNHLKRLGQNTSKQD